MAARLSRYKSETERQPLKETVAQSTAYGRSSRCRVAIKKHHELLKDDPERLTTEFLVKITGCKCKHNPEGIND